MFTAMDRRMTDSLTFVLFFTVLLSQLYPIATKGKPTKPHKNKTAIIQTPVNINELTPGLMTPIFEVMRYHGEAKRNEFNKKIKDQNKRKPKSKRNFGFTQYLLITIVSKDEIDQAKHSGKSFQEDFTNQNKTKHQRLIFLLNKRNHRNEYYNPDRELHGEIIAIYFGKIERLMDDFKNNPKTKYKYPIILLYTNYLPCAHVSNLGYSCSEELMNYAKGRIHEFTMLVAYTTVFKNTDEKSSFDFMRKGGINVFMYKANGSYTHKLKVFNSSSIDGIKKTFQGEAYDCLINPTPPKCCAGNQKNRTAIAAYFINHATSQCIAKFNASRLFTELSRNQLKICLKRN